MQHLGKWYGMLHGCLLWQLPREFKINCQNEDGSFVEYLLALAFTTIPENSCNLVPGWKFVQVRNVPAVVDLEGFSMGNIVGCTHVVLERATSWKTGDGRNEQRIVNSHIDLMTWNDDYN